MICTDPLIKRMTIPFLAMAAFALLTNQAMATPATWNGSADSQWSNPNNWDGLPASVPGSGEQATFDGAGNGSTTLDLGGGVSSYSLSPREILNDVTFTATTSGHSMRLFRALSSPGSNRSYSR